MLCVSRAPKLIFVSDQIRGHITEDIFGSGQPPSMFSNFCSGVAWGRSYLVGDNQHDFFLPHSSYSGDVYLLAKDP